MKKLIIIIVGLLTLTSCYKDKTWQEKVQYKKWYNTSYSKVDGSGMGIVEPRLMAMYEFGEESVVITHVETGREKVMPVRYEEPNIINIHGTPHKVLSVDRHSMQLERWELVLHFKDKK